MATHLEWFLAQLDEILTKMFGLERHGSVPGCDGSAKSWSYWTLWGQKFAIVDEKGNVSALGGSWWTIHRYDKDGQLLSRKRMVKSIKSGQHVIYGYERAYQAYATQPQFQTH